MSGHPEAYLGGGLATHARGRTLSATFKATACETLPASGALFVPGKELQACDERARSWADWVTSSGRVLIALPPFSSASTELPVRWEARRTDPLAGGETDLGRLLARERKHEIRGQMLSLERSAGQVVTAGWRKHPAAGLIVITTLPVWSLTALDHADACTSWLMDLVQQAGKPTLPLEDEGEATGSALDRTPTPEEWTMLLHLCTGPFEDAEKALGALSRSAIHKIPAECAGAILEEVSRLGLAQAGGLTEAGRRALFDGPYGTYARALRRRA